MTRDAFADKLLDLAYGELSPREARKVEAHAASCDACRAELARIRETRSLMARLPEEPAPEKGERVLAAAAREAAERRAPPRRFLPRWAWGASVVAASLVVVAAISYRMLELRPGPLASKPDDKALLGGGYPTPPQAPAPAPESAAELGGVAPADEQERRDDLAALRRAAAPRPPEGKKAAAPRAERAQRAFAQPPPAAAEGAPATLGRQRDEPRAVAGSGAPGRGEAAGERAELRAVPAPGPAAPPAAAEAAPAPQAAAPPPPPAAAMADAEPRRRAVEQEAAGVRRPGAKARAEAAAPRDVASGNAGALTAPPRVASRSFPGCEGELARTVETDAQGRVVRYVREGTIGGRRLRIVQSFRPDGAPASTTAVDLGAGGAPVDARALGIALADRAEDASIDAPPRCGR
jgi:hypothetical protein